MLKYHSYPTKFTADQYLQSRIDAAKRVLDYDRRSLAVDWEIGLSIMEFLVGKILDGLGVRKHGMLVMVHSRHQVHGQERSGINGS